MAVNLEINFGSISEVNGGLLVKLKGELDDANVNMFIDKLEEKAGDKIIAVIVDFEDIRFIDTSAALALYQLNTKLAKLGKMFKVFGISPYIINVLQDLGVLKVMPVFKSYEEAIRGLK